MSSENKLTASLTRRSWLVLSASALTSCGGGTSIGLPGTGGSGTMALPGTGGTGIYVQGSILGFGSVWVNGIKFDDSAATVQLEGQSGRSSDLRLGMVASVQGQRDADVTLGVASSIDVWSIAQGAVTSVLAGQFTLAGMTILTDGGTVFDGLAGASALAPGLTVKVWGLQSSLDGNRWTATRVAVVNATAVVSTGTVTTSGSMRYVNGLKLSGSAVAGLTAGVLVRVQGTMYPAGNTLQVDSVKLLSADSNQVPQGEAEIEGLVTSVLSATRFILGTVEVDTTNATFSPAGSRVVIGGRLEVGGIWQAGVLKAAKVELEDVSIATEIEIEAPIEAYTNLGNFVVRGQRCDATLATISHGSAADLRVGVKVHIKGALSGNVVLVSQLELDS